MCGHFARVIPAWAGNIPPSGDEQIRIQGYGSSPRGRGTFAPSDFVMVPSRCRVIPAWAGNMGMVILDDDIEEPCRVIPAWAGNMNDVTRRSQLLGGRVIPAWAGNIAELAWPVIATLGHRVIPAWAGNMATPRLIEGIDRGHGSSPRGRGTYLCAVRHSR